jgi:hypothetical protein
VGAHELGHDPMPDPSAAGIARASSRSSGQDQQIGVIHDHRKLSGGRLRQTSLGIELGLGGELDLLLGGSAHPALEPLSCQVGLSGTQSPGARPDQDLSPQAVELLDGKRHSVRAEQAAPGRRAALVGVERGGHAAVQRIRRGQAHATDDRQSQQRRTRCAGTDGDQRGQLFLGQDVQERGGGDERCPGEVAWLQPGQVRLLDLESHRSPVSSRAG